MKKIYFLVILVLIIAGCADERQQPKDQAGYPAPMMQSQEEILHLEQLAKQAPKNPEGWTMLGNAFMDSGRFMEAVDAYEKALALKPKDVDVRVDRGTCYRNAGKPQQALEEYRKALKINPDHAMANRNMGVVLAFDLHDKKGAIKAYEKYLQIAPTGHDADDIRQLVQKLKSGN